MTKFLVQMLIEEFLRYSSEGYTNTYGEVVAGREIGQCLYMVCYYKVRW